MTKQTAEQLDQALVDELKIGEAFEVKFSIADGDWGSSSVDKRETVTYTAPTGLVVLGHEINRRGHHSSASWVRTNQAGAISYETGVLATLTQKLRDGFLKGSLTFKGKKLAEGDAAAEYSRFLKEFRAKYRFYAATNSSITFRWTTNTKTGRFGARIKADAVITLAKVATEEEAERAVEMIRFAIESGQTNDIFELMESVLGQGKSAKDAGLKPADAPDTARIPASEEDG